MKIGALLLIGIVGNFQLGAVELPEGLLTSLQSEDFQQREESQKQILDWARASREESIEILFRHFRESPDPEVRERCLDILRSLVNDDYLKDGKGYIGIRMQNDFANVPGDAQPRASIRVIGIVADSAAEKAGLNLNDQIVGLGDEIWREGAAAMTFSEKIQQLKPNTRIILKILRDGGMIEVPVVLGRRPVLADDPFMNQSEEDIELAERASREEFFRRWLELKKSAK